MQTLNIPLEVLASTWDRFPQAMHLAGDSRYDQRTAIFGTAAALQWGHLCIRANATRDP